MGVWKFGEVVVKEGFRVQESRIIRFKGTCSLL